MKHVESPEKNSRESAQEYGSRRESWVGSSGNASPGGAEKEPAVAIR